MFTALAGGPHTVQSIVVDPERTDTIYTGTQPGSIYQSLNRSLTWTEMPAAAATIAEGVLTIAFNPLNANVVYAGGDMSGLFPIDRPWGELDADVSGDSPSAHVYDEQDRCGCVRHESNLCRHRRGSVDLG